jgi:hypothetical protein
MNIKIPINNSVEVVVADLYVNVQCKLQPQVPIERTEARIALNTLEAKLNIIFQEAVYKAKKELEKEIED